MTDRPILFSAPMVRAILGGRKSQTRRVLKLGRELPDFRGGLGDWNDASSWGWCDDDGQHIGLIPDLPGDYHWGQYQSAFHVGDRLWVRESFSYDDLDIDRDGTLPPWYWADGNFANPDQGSGNFTKPKPSIHMPRWASRTTLIVTDVRVERLQEISFQDTIREGVQCPTCYAIMAAGGESACYEKGCFASKQAFRDLWDSINGKHPAKSWAANPWVVALSFDVVRANIDKMGDLK